MRRKGHIEHLSGRKKGLVATLETIKTRVTLKGQWLQYSAAVTGYPLVWVCYGRIKEMQKALVHLSLVLLVACAAVSAAQNSNLPISDRKVTSRVAPAYPELARRMRLQGTVKIEAVVKPNGTVKSTRVLGGNPVLVDAATEAVTKWKFESGPSETMEIVQLTFAPQQ